MKFAGNVTVILGRRRLIVKSDAGQLPPLYSEVADERSRPIGQIVDLYGSVANPYLTVSCNDDVRIRSGDSLYVIPNSKPEKPGKKRYYASGYMGLDESNHPKPGGLVWKKKSKS